MKTSRSLPFVFYFVLLSLTQALGSMAEEPEKHAGGSEDGASAVHIVYVDRPEGEDPEAFHIRTLASVVGSEDAAKEALVYSYTHAASGFSAKLTPKQVQDLSSRPGVLQVVPSRTLHLHSGERSVGHFGLT